MSSIAISAQAHAMLPSAAFRTHRRDVQGTTESDGIADVGKPGQLPAGTGPGLLANAAQSLQHTAAARINGAPALIGGSLNVTA